MKKCNYIFIIAFISLLNLKMGAQTQVDSISYYYDKGDLEKAISYGEHIKKTYELEKNTNQPDYVQSLKNLAFVYAEEGEYKKAEPLYLQVLDIKKKTLGEDHLDYAKFLNHLGLFYKKQSEFQKAEPLYLKALGIRKKKLGENHPDYVIVLTNLASLYYNKGEYQKAEKLFLQSLIIEKSIVGENHPDYAYSLSKLASIYRRQGEYAKAEPLFLQALSINKEVLGENHPDYASSLHNLASLYRSQGEYAKSESLFLQALSINKEILGENHPDYASSLNNLALLYDNQGEYQKAEPLYLQVLAIRKNVFGENHHDYAGSLNNLALFYMNLGEYQKAEPLYLQSLAIDKKVLGVNHPNYSTDLNNLAGLYARQGEYQKAKAFFLEALDVIKKVLGENDIDYAISLNNLASLYHDKGEYQYAEPLYIKSIAIKKKVLGENHPDYASSLNNLALLYSDQGEYQKEEPLLLRALTIKKNVLGENHPDYAVSLNNLATFYENQGEYQKAELLFLQSLAIRKNVLGENHPDYARSLSNLALLYHKQGEYQKEESLYLQVLEIIKKVLGENHPDYATSLDNLASFYKYQGKYQKAELQFLQALSIRKKKLGENHADYATSLNNLASLYQNQEEYKKAEPLYLQSLVINKMFLGENHPHYAVSIKNLALFYQSIKPENKEKAAFYLQASFLQFQNYIKQAGAYKSEKEFSFFRIKNFQDRFSTLSFLYRNTTQYHNINIGCYETELLVKNLSLSNKHRLVTSIQKSGNAEMQNKYEKFVNNKKQLVKWNELPIDKKPSEYEQVNSETETLEKDLVIESDLFADSKNASAITWKQVQDKLKPNEIAIDLVSFNYHNKKWTDSIMCSAFVVSKTCKFPKFIPLFEQKQLEFLLTGNDETKQRDKIDKHYADKAISNLFLNPLQKELDGITTIYLSPAGLGHQIDFSALSVSETQTLGEKYRVHILGSTAEIVNYKVAELDKKNNLELLLYGGIDYDKSEIINNLNDKPVENNSNSEFVALATRSGISKWDYLAGTQKEVGQINDKSQQTGFASTIINGRLATEESIKKMDGRTNPYVLHLATHGFFFPDPKQELPGEKLQLSSEMNKAKIYKTSDDPMMRSGLLFAGANKYWNKTTENIATEDGILTASEISNLDLSACQLVVLSACETGLGEIKGSEGVFGLQRAFKMAGVKNIIMSLWKVPDAQTAELFDIFYSECFAGKTIHEAFQSAQTKMKAKYSPYYWAGFVLLE